MPNWLTASSPAGLLRISTLIRQHDLVGIVDIRARWRADVSPGPVASELCFQVRLGLLLGTWTNEALSGEGNDSQDWAVGPSHVLHPRRPSTDKHDNCGGSPC
jgi:hypothetical protein